MIASIVSWRELQAYVSTLREKNPSWKVWNDIQEPDRYCIDFLVQTHWKIVPCTDEMNEWYWGMGSVDHNKRIFYREELRGKERDITICHELAHVFYPANIYKETNRENWECIIEWIGRNWRAKPEVLREIIEGFKVRPHL